MALEDLNPAVRVEEILDGADIEPATRLEYFMKKAANEVPKPAGSSDAGKVVTVNEDGDSFTLDDVPEELPAYTSADEGKVLSVAVEDDEAVLEWVEVDSGPVVESVDNAAFKTLLETTLNTLVTAASNDNDRHCMDPAGTTGNVDEAFFNQMLNVHLGKVVPQITLLGFGSRDMRVIQSNYIDYTFMQIISLHFIIPYAEVGSARYNAFLYITVAANSGVYTAQIGGSCQKMIMIT